MPNPVFTYIKWFVNSFCRYIFKQDWAHSFVHGLMVSIIFNTNISIYYSSFVYTQLNGFKYCYILLIIQLNSHLFTQS